MRSPRIVGYFLACTLALPGLLACGDAGPPEGMGGADTRPDAAAAHPDTLGAIQTDTFQTGTPDPSLPFDVSIEGGAVIDGTGAPGRPADLLLKDGRIVYVGPLDPDTLEIVERFDAAGQVVAPGFVDAHAHGDPASGTDFANFLAQGVTTILLGQDGSSPAAGSLAGHLDAVERAGTTVNVAYLAGHNTLRGESGLGFQPGETAEAHGPLVDLVRQALEDGAFGVSLGLEYSPGGAAGPEELAGIGRVVAEHDGVLMAHLRTEDRGEVAGAVDELLEVRRRTDARVHVSHLKVVLGPDPSEADQILALMEAARGSSGPGGGVTADLYPYLASFTGVSILFPDWARPPNDYAAVRRTRGDELAAYLRERVNSRNGPGATLFATGPWAGRTLEEAARAEDRPFEDLLVDLGPGGARAAYFVMDPAVMRRFLADPHVAVASDGSPTMGHPRGYGSFVRVLREHVDEALELEEVVRKMTTLPASIIGLDDSTRVRTPRGRIAPGWAADVLVFDPAEVRDRADFQDPHRLAEGVVAVWVNGTRSWPISGARTGQVLRDR